MIIIDFIVIKFMTADDDNVEHHIHNYYHGSGL